MQLLPSIVQFLALALLLALAYKPLGDYMARLYTNTHDLGVEKMIYRGIGVDPRRGQTWVAYVRSLLAFSFVSIILLYALQRLQSILPYSLGMPGVEPGVAFNTAISFVTNTNWQSYSPEQTLGYTVQAVGLTVQNFLSAAVGMSVAAALMRGLAARNAQEIGNFWVDLIRTTLRLLLPISVIGALILVSLGVIQNFHPFQAIQTLSGGTQNIPGGPVASQEVIKNLGTNGGGFFNANASHPFENPNPVSSLFQIFLMLLIPFALPRTFGKIVGDQRQGSAVLGVMALFYVLSLSLVTFLENAGLGSAPHMAGAAMEGKEQRFGIASSVLFGTSSTLTSTGAVNSMHDSYTAFGGLMPMLNMMLGEVAPGGVGSGLYGMLILAIVTVFVGGLLVGRTPEYLGKKIGRREIKLASLYILVMPTLVLAGVALSFAIPGVRQSVEEVSLANTGHHGLSEVIYAFTSAANNNGSAFAGLTASTPWFATALGFAMLLGRLVPIILVLALAGAFAAQDRIPATSGTLPTHRPLFAGMLAGVTVLVTALTFFPMLTLGPISEGLIK